MNYDRIQFITGFVLTSMTRFTPFGKMRKAISFNHMIKSRPIEKMLSGKDELLKKMLKLSRSGWGGRAVAVAFRRSHWPFSKYSDFLHRKKVLSGFLVSHKAIYK